MNQHSLRYESHGSGVLLVDCGSFAIDETLECGQFFQYRRIETESPGTSKEYSLTAFSKVLRVRQDQNAAFFFPTDIQEFETVWIPFFDLRRDYQSIKETLSENDLIMCAAVQCSPGIRILKQDPWECLLSFILSQNNNIARVKQMAQTITQTFGQPLSDGWHSFPSPDQIGRLTLDALQKCKTGFRGKYILDAAHKIASGDVDLSALADAPSSQARTILTSIQGVGPKIADCALLFAYQKTDVFPTDVWIKRTMERRYFHDQKTSLDAIQRLAQNQFGDLAGYAQQYLFAQARRQTSSQEHSPKIG
ncbi:MAG: DNA-3-methyladenine glycosylase 2 family protein [Clostridiales bacterium]|jgi:N-glycosylase/DNA lyase|nr:DNA-3-methyladenine glycosylase 2 family protein [Clostridiales bacterium]